MNTDDTTTTAAGHEGDERWQRAVAGRLAKLGTMPVETARLERMLDAQIAPPAARRSTLTRLWSSRPLRAVAASLLLVATAAVFVLFVTSGGPVLASPARMVQVHEDLVSGRARAVRVDSIEAANRALAEQSPESPELPDLPQEHVMACCMKSVQNKKLACLLMNRDGVPVSMVVARQADMRPPDAPTVERNGVRFHVQSHGNVRMVMALKGNRWVCLIGALPAESLINIVDQLRF
jgi:hypothetical protein